MKNVRRTRANRGMLVLAGLGFVALLSGCAATAAESISPSTTASPSASPEVETPAAVVTALVIRPEAIDLNDDSGATVTSLSYEVPATEMVAALSAAIGAEPTSREHDGGLESPPGVYYEWDGLTISDPEPTSGTFPELTNLQLSVTAPAVGNLESIATVQGYSVGTETAPILAENGWTLPDSAYFHFPAEFGPVLGEPSGDNPDFLNAWAVSMSSEPPATTITQIFAPTNFGVQGH